MVLLAEVKAMDNQLLYVQEHRMLGCSGRPLAATTHCRGRAGYLVINNTQLPDSQATTP